MARHHASVSWNTLLRVGWCGRRTCSIPVARIFSARGGRLARHLSPSTSGGKTPRMMDDADVAAVGGYTPAPRLSGRLGDALVAAGKLSRAEVEQAAAAARQAGSRLGRWLCEHGLADERDVWRILGEHHGLHLASLEDIRLVMDLKAFRAVPRRFQDRQRVVILDRQGDTAVVATTEPDLDVSGLKLALGTSHVDVRLVTPTDHRRIMSLADLGSLDPQTAARLASMDSGDLLTKDPLAQAHLVTLFDSLVLDAIAERASDIHVERYLDRTRIRIRVDGDLRDVTGHILTDDEAKGLLNVIKVTSNLDIAEHRLPQGGRARTQVGGRHWDMRVQTQPTLHGENVVIRLLAQSTRMLAIEDLGFSADLARTYRRLLASPQGLVLVVGPTGSGKSTTLYAGLQVLAQDTTRKVITAEDPIEYALEGVQQTQVRPELGFSFDQAMRVFVREDPDVILLGEIRDKETALEALRASQTGHLVLSTLHCNDAVDAVQRLVDLDMHPNSISSELLAVFAQRLAKRLCPHCRVPATPPPDVAAEVFPMGVPSGFRCFRGAGCDRCGGHGTHGRIAVLEHLAVGPEMRRGISRHMHVDELRAVALRAGLRDMRLRALELIHEGLMGMDELLSLLPQERLAPPKEIPAGL